MTFLELRVLGNFEARDKANQLVDVSAKKNRALLAILALSPSGWVPRQQLANLLWSDREDVHARMVLRLGTRLRSCVNKSCVRPRERQLPKGTRLPQKPCPLRNSLNDPSIAVLPFMNDPAHKPGPVKSSTAVMKRKMAALMVGNVVGYGRR